MRIENNNVSFGAYFKNNQEFKKMMSRSAFHKPDLIDKFVHEMPNHEVEIIGRSESEGCIWYMLHNNTTKQFAEINTGTMPIYGLNKLIEGLTDYMRSCFWGKDNATTNYNKLTNRQ